jgi:hypothetical protein
LPATSDSLVNLLRDHEIMSHHNDYDCACEQLLFDLLVREMSFGMVIFSIEQFMSRLGGIVFFFVVMLNYALHSQLRIYTSFFCSVLFKFVSIMVLYTFCRGGREVVVMSAVIVHSDLSCHSPANSCIGRIRLADCRWAGHAHIRVREFDISRRTVVKGVR